jgi:predicted ATPase
MSLFLLDWVIEDNPDYRQRTTEGIALYVYPLGATSFRGSRPASCRQLNSSWKNKASAMVGCSAVLESLRSAIAVVAGAGPVDSRSTNSAGKQTDWVGRSGSCIRSKHRRIAVRPTLSA